MTDKQIELLKKQLDNLSAKDFNLEAWKISTKLLLERIFGPGNPRAREIEKIHYDLSSWALRDSLGASSTLDACKRTGRAVLEACILELETLGDAGAEAMIRQLDISALMNVLENHLTVSQLRRLREVVQSELESGEKISKLREYLSQLGEDKALDITAEFLSQPAVSSKI